MPDQHSASITGTDLSQNGSAGAPPSSDQRAVDGGSVEATAIDSLRPADSPRLRGVDMEHVRTLAEAGDALPPIVVNRATMQVIDGMHRLGAARLNGQRSVNAVFFSGSREEAFLLAVKANIAHGLPLTLVDRRAAAERIIVDRPRLSDGAIAEVTGLSTKTVATIRRRMSDQLPQSNTRVGRDGRVRPLDSTGGRRIASDMIVAQPGASLRRIAEQAGISVGTARDVRRRVMAGEDPVPASQRPDSAGARPAKTTPAGAPVDRSTVEIDPRRIVAGLRQDPSLRYTEAGRALLRWLGLRTIVASEWRGVVDDLPPHCPATVSKVARACAAAWLEFAEELDRRSGRSATTESTNSGGAC